MAKRRQSPSIDSSSWSDHEISNSASDSESEYDDASFHLQSRFFNSKKKNKAAPRKKRKANEPASRDSEQAGGYADVPLHAKSTHVISSPQAMRSALLDWYETVRDIRGMPWRRPYDPHLGPEERAQRAYEVWVSEIMLQQTQVTTVIPYYNRWMERFPTIRDLAEATIDEVNKLWKGLGYYSRASRLLAGAQKAVNEYNGRLPDNAKDMEANIPGIGRYSAGAICSIAYGEKAPVLDGNVHRLLSRFIALHAPPKSKQTLDVLWAAASALVDIEDTSPITGGNHGAQMVQHPGDINQALIELGSTVCKVRQPDCDKCPLQTWCSAYQHSKGVDARPSDTPIDIEDVCHLCEPISSPISVSSYPMKADRKKAREELDIVHVVEWRANGSSTDRYFLMTRRPEQGLLAGLYDFPTSVAVPTAITRHDQELLSSAVLSKLLSGFLSAPTAQELPESEHEISEKPEIIKIHPVGDVLHIFSHIRKTYRVQWIILEGGDKPPVTLSLGEDFANKIKKGKRTAKAALPRNQVDNKGTVIWVPLDKVMETNMGTGVIKVWNLTRKLWE
ncbi:hypothetical protein CVT26_012107 [Gymnopilus dilepis]|uniref:Adenine DNA glycosylase n=1 Tax=Gymnopilus dilepis TaxID=231916 RepID=A0A409YGW9_9AGAR|nr:hypothetical protein CVT26_012107 [Gymnopilus dilepis]